MEDVFVTDRRGSVGDEHDYRRKRISLQFKGRIGHKDCVTFTLKSSSAKDGPFNSVSPEAIGAK